MLVLGVAVALFLPLFTWRAAAALEAELLARSRSSPILLGRAGNEVDLTLSSLYFRGQVDRAVPYDLAERVLEHGVAVPLHVRHRAGGRPVLGTEPEYFFMRDLEPAEGRLPVWLGEVVAGAALAADLRLEVGDTVRSDSSNLYNLSGAYPLLLEVVGILRPSTGPDDDVWITDIKTAWAMDGLFHGHDAVNPEGPGADGDEAVSDAAGLEDLASEDLASEDLASEDLGPDDSTDNVEASAALFLFSEITPRNRHTFHLHGDPGEAPVSAFLVAPRDRRAHDRILAELALDELYQAVRPETVVRSLLDIVLQVRDGLQTYFGLVALSTTALFALVTYLGLRLRRRELALMARMGCDRRTLRCMIGAEILLVTLAAAFVATATAEVALRVLSHRL